MAGFIHINNVLLELSRITTFGWVKELCYRTLNNGVLDEAGLQVIYDLFAGGGAAVSAEPAITPEQVLRLTKMTHVEGVNALKAGTEIAFCEEGITLVYGQNATGKSGYYRVLEHLAGGQFAQTVLQDIYKANPAVPHCRIDYKLGAAAQPTFEWDNTDATKGQAPFDVITVFDSRYTNYLVKQHSPDTYLLHTHGFFDFADFQTNVENLVAKVMEEIPDKEPALHIPELNALNLEGVYDRYLTALQAQLDIEIKGLLGKNRDISVAKLIDAGKPYLVVKLSVPHDVEKVLSEGEIKAVALALLISDLELKGKKNPVVLDDPVNSLDNNIIRKFAERLIALPNPVILFTHNIWLRNYLLDNKKKVHKYSVNSLLTDRVDAAKRHLMSYMVLSIGKEKGAVDGSDNESAAYYIAAAKRAIDTVPFTAVEVESATQLLRKSVEMLVDEKVFLNLEPCKFRGNHQNILWDELLNLKHVPDATIQTLQEQYNVLSSAGAHVGMAAAEDALDHDDLEAIYNELMAIV